MKLDEGTGKMSILKNWFFKGRIEKRLLEGKRIDKLSKEYDEDKIIPMG